MSQIFPVPDIGERRFDVITFGTNAFDHLITVPVFPEFDSKIEMTDSIMLPGGEAASTAVGLARLGAKVAYIGSFGDDVEGELGRRSLIDEGVDITNARTVSGARTQLGYIIIERASGERTVIWRRDKLLAFTADDLSDEIAGDCRILHLTPHDIGAAIAFARSARRYGTVVSIDADRVINGIDELLELVDICLLPGSLVTELSGLSEIESALRTINKRYGCRLVGATLGARGSTVLFDGQFIRVDGFAVPGGCIDTTGAGDAFRAGLIFGLLSTESIENACRFANGAAALKCRMPGARAGLPNKVDLTTFCKKQ